MVTTLLSAIVLSAALPVQTLLAAAIADEVPGGAPGATEKKICIVTCGDPAQISAASGRVRKEIVILRGADASQPQVCRTRNICVGPDGPMIAMAGPHGDEHAVVLVATTGEPAEPKVWIGVRITAVPEPLAAHIGEQGVMILNIVVGSPADRAGLDRYDVVVAYDGQATDSPKDLTEVVAQTAAGQEVNLTIIRAGQPRTIKLAPAERTPDQGYELKYDEPEDVLLHDDVALRGLRLLQRGQGGHEWIIEQLGPLYGLPDALKELEDLHVDLDVHLDDLEDLLDARGPGHDFDVRIFNHPGQGFTWHADADSDVSVQFKIKMEEDGRSLTIEAGSDGVIHVSRTDPDGHQSSATYDSAEELEKADPEAYEVYSKHVPGGGLSCITVTPSGDKAHKLQQQFQIDVELKLKEALEHAHRAAEEAKQRGEREVRAAREAYETARTFEAHARPGGDDATLGVRIAADGSITAYARDKQGHVQRYAFTSKGAFQTAEPELYEKFKDLLE